MSNSLYAATPTDKMAMTQTYLNQVEKLPISSDGHYIFEQFNEVIDPTLNLLEN